MIKNSPSSNLNKLVAFYAKTTVLNELMQETPTYEFYKNVWADVQLASSKMKTVVENTFFSEFTHKITIRADALNVKNDMEIEYEGIRYAVLYHEPCYSDKALTIIYAKSVQE